jgi:hypothetical protein
MRFYFILHGFKGLKELDLKNPFNPFVNPSIRVKITSFLNKRALKLYSHFSKSTALFGHQFEK